MTYLSNLAEPRPGGSRIGSNETIAQSFVTGGASGSFTLNSIQISALRIGTPIGNFSLSLYSNNGGIPGSLIGPLSGPNPSAEMTYTYTASGISLAPQTTYWVAATGTAPIGSANGDYIWNYSSTLNYSAIGDWSINSTGNDFALSATGGQSWTPFSGRIYQFAVNASPVPEPGTWALMLCGGISAAMARKRTPETRFGERPT